MLSKLTAAIISNLDAHKVTRFKDAGFLGYGNSGLYSCPKSPVSAEKDLFNCTCRSRLLFWPRTPGELHNA
jgi:hypothetical protein